MHANWLLVGGPAHGTHIVVRDSVAKVFLIEDAPPCGPIRRWEYRGEVYCINGLYYQIGTWHPSPMQFSEVPWLLQSKNIPPLK